MTENRKDAGPGAGETPPPVDRLVTRHQIFEVMSYEGYSADQRKDWLKSALTYAAKRHEQAPSEETAAIVRELEKLSQSGAPSGRKAPRAEPED